MTPDDLQALLPKLEEFHGRFHDYFPRSESRARAKSYLIGLNLPIERKNAENIAEEMGMAPRRLQQFLTNSTWDADGCVDELQRLVGEELGEEAGVLILDGTGFPKKGTCSAGVARQYSGTLGRTDNCQVGVFLDYASKWGHTLVDRQLYIPERWFEEGEVASARRGRAGLPEELEFQTKLAQAGEMLKSAEERGKLPYRWVGGDAEFGDSHDLRKLVEGLEKWYLFEVNSTAEVWTQDPGWEVPVKAGGRGRRPRRARATEASPKARGVAEVSRKLGGECWRRHRVIEGAKGPREYEFARLRVIEKRHGEPGPEAWMMVRRGVGCRDSKQYKHYLSNAPERVSLREMAWVGCLRWTIEEDFEQSKGELGLDHYESTIYRAWYHHITLVLLALAFVKLVQREWG